MVRGYSLIDKANNITGCIKVIDERSCIIRFVYPTEIKEDFVRYLSDSFRGMGFETHALFENANLHASSRGGMTKHIGIQTRESYNFNRRQLGDHRALQILNLLKIRDTYIADIAKQTGTSFTAVRWSLDKLVKEGKITKYKIGNMSFYKIANPVKTKEGDKDDRTSKESEQNKD
jgi:DNA-binding transcriptional ArsR family regulator